MTGIEMPIKLKDIPKFKSQNDISVSVYAWEPEKKNEDGEDEIGFAYTLRVAKDVEPCDVNLLMIGDKIKHYCWIKNFSRLVSAQYSEQDGELAYCRFCLHRFCGKPIVTYRVHVIKTLNDVKMIMRKNECFVHGGQKTSFPEEPYVEFKAIEKQVMIFYLFTFLTFSI